LTAEFRIERKFLLLGLVEVGDRPKDDDEALLKVRRKRLSCYSYNDRPRTARKMPSAFLSVVDDWTPLRTGFSGLIGAR
jgi:hypothetical protein